MAKLLRDYKKEAEIIVSDEVAKQEQDYISSLYRVIDELEEASELLWKARDLIDTSGDEDAYDMANLIEDKAQMIDDRIVKHKAYITRKHKTIK